MYPVGFEPTVARVETECIIQLCYGYNRLNGETKPPLNYCRLIFKLVQASKVQSNSRLVKLAAKFAAEQNLILFLTVITHSSPI